MSQGPEVSLEAGGLEHEQWVAPGRTLVHGRPDPLLFEAAPSPPPPSKRDPRQLLT